MEKASQAAVTHCSLNKPRRACQATVSGGQQCCRYNIGFIITIIPSVVQVAQLQQALANASGRCCRRAASSDRCPTSYSAAAAGRGALAWPHAVLEDAKALHAGAAAARACHAGCGRSLLLACLLAINAQLSLRLRACLLARLLACCKRKMASLRLRGAIRNRQHVFCLLCSLCMLF